MAAKTATTKITGAASKVARQSKLSPVRSDESQQQQEQQPVNTQPVTEQIALADLQAQKRAILEQLKAAKANQPKVEKQPKPSKTLHDVVERQAETIGIGHVLYIAQRAMTRVKMGQDAAQAVNAVAAREAEAAVGALELMATGDYPSLREALIQWCTVHAPLTVTKQHTKITDGDESTDTTGK